MRVNTKLLIILIALSSIIITTVFTTYKIEAVEEINIIDYNKDYTLKIDYPITQNKIIDNKIKRYVMITKDDFIRTTSFLNYKHFIYDFIMNYNLIEFDNIKYIHLMTYQFTGGNHYQRLDKTFIYDVNTGREIDLNYFFKENYLPKLSKLSYDYIIKKLTKEDAALIDDMIKDGTQPILSNFEHFYFNEEGLNILFPPYQVAPWSFNEINITIPYEEINSILKESFIKKSIPSKEKPVFNEIPRRDISGFKGKKLIALTFDDGPSYRTTNKLIEGLKERNARATFFILGNKIKRNADIIEEMYLEGNQIGSHTYNHKNLFLLKDDKILNEINKTKDELKLYTGINSNLLRPPYGNINNRIKSLVKSNIILWDVDPLDWKYKNSDRVAKNIVRKAYDGAVVLLHDIYMSSVDGALKAIDILKEQGYEFVTIDEMCELKEINLDTNKTYFNF